MTNPAGRRDRLRAETVAELKDRAWTLMAESGPGALSLRQVAREMGMAPSALYRYFSSRNDLLTALIVDAFDSLAEVVQRAYDDSVADAGLHAFIEVCRAYRNWAMEHRIEWALIFSSSIPDYNGTEQTKLASMRVTNVLMQIMSDAVAAEQIDLDALEAVLDEPLRLALSQWSEWDEFTFPAAARIGAMWCYAVLHGCIALDLNEHLPPALLGNETLFVSALRAMVAQISR